MSFISFSLVAWRALVVVLGAVPFVAVAGGPGYAADSQITAVPPAPKSMTGAPSGSELVGKLLAERSTASDPEVPLPQRNLIVPEPAFVPLTGPRIYGRGDEGSVVVGLKIPFPADRGALQANTRYRGAGAGAAVAGSAR